MCPLLVLIDPAQPCVQREHGQKGVASCRGCRAASIETEAGGRMMISVSMPFYRHTDTDTHVEYNTDWWFGTCFIFPYIGKNHPT